MTTLFRSQTLASLPNSRLKTPIVPGPQTSWVISTSALTQTLSPACTRGLPAARAKTFSVNVINPKSNCACRVFRPRTARLNKQLTGEARPIQPGLHLHLRHLLGHVGLVLIVFLLVSLELVEHVVR